MAFPRKNCVADSENAVVLRQAVTAEELRRCDGRRSPIQSALCLRTAKGEAVPGAVMARIMPWEGEDHGAGRVLCCGVPRRWRVKAITACICTTVRCVSRIGELRPADETARHRAGLFEDAHGEGGQLGVRAYPLTPASSNSPNKAANLMTRRNATI